MRVARPDVALPGDRRVVGVLLVLGVLLSGPAVAGATPRGASSRHVDASSAVPPGDPVLDGGRVWWLTVPSGTSTTATLRSRSVADRHARAVPLPLPAPFDPADDRQLPAPPVLSVGAGLAAAQLSWWSGNDPGVATRTEPSYVAAFDARSGSPLAAVRFRQSAATLVPGSDLVTAPVGPDPTDGTFGTFPVLDPAGTVAVRPDQVAGPYALTYSGFRPEGYLLLPLYAWVASRIAGNSARRELLLIGLLAVLSVGFRLWVRRLDTNVSYLAPLPGMLGWFTVGMAIAVLTRHGDRTLLSRLAAHRFVCWGAAAVVYAVASFSHQSGIASTGLFVAYGLIAGLVVLPSAVPSPEGGRGRVFGALSWLGLISYGIYLYHYPLMRWYAEHVHVDGGAGYALIGVLALTSAIAAGAISYYVLEKQVLRFKRVDPLAWVPGR